MTWRGPLVAGKGGSGSTNRIDTLALVTPSLARRQFQDSNGEDKYTLALCERLTASS
jgi:hypothetical protein